MAEDFYVKNKILAHEQQCIQASLANGYSDVAGFSVAPDAIYTLKKQLDREPILNKAEALIAEYTADSSSSQSALAQAVAGMQQEERRRRDAYISLVGHRELMRSCLNTAYRRTKRIDIELQR